MLYKYPQAEFPYARLVEENRARGSGRRIRADRHRRLRRRPLLRRVRRIRQGRPGRHPDRDHASTTAGRRRRRCTCCRSSGSATPGPGADGRKPAVIHRRQRRRTGAPHTRRSASISSMPKARRRSCCSATTKPMQRGCSAMHATPGISRTRFTNTSSQATATR